jgi:hypothetical protein
MQQRRGATFAARTVTFLFARDRKRRDTPRALARISACGGDELAGPGGGQQSNDIPLRFPRGAGATFARAKRAAPRQTPAANGVTAHGRGKRTGMSERTERRGRACSRGAVFADLKRRFVQPALQKR